MYYPPLSGVAINFNASSTKVHEIILSSAITKLYLKHSHSYTKLGEQILAVFVCFWWWRPLVCDSFCMMLKFLGHRRHSICKSQLSEIIYTYEPNDLRRDNWIHFAIGHIVLLHWIQTKPSWKPDIVVN